MKRTRAEVLHEIRLLVSEPGYIYALCLIAHEAFTISHETIANIDWRSRLNANEMSLLLGVLIQKDIDLTKPHYTKLFDLRKRTYDLMSELHATFTYALGDQLTTLSKTTAPDELQQHARQYERDFFGKGDSVVEAIFYSGTGIYDFQYLEHLKNKYKYDQDWLLQQGFDLSEAETAVKIISELISSKFKKISIYLLKEDLDALTEKLYKKAKKPSERLQIEEQIFSALLYQYKALFTPSDKDLSEHTPEKGWNSFYDGLLELFIISKDSLDQKYHFIIDKFFVSPGEGTNCKFQSPGNYNVVESHPFVKLKTGYFILSSFMIYRAVYESPFYWMFADKGYRSLAAKNRGIVSEEIAYDMLVKVFGDKNTLKSIKIISKKGNIDTDIDILCVLGSKALCVQIKSKKLTELSRLGDSDGLEKDFRLAVQEAYNQALISREKVIAKDAKFLDSNNKIIELPEDVDEVYLMVLNTEVLPFLNTLGRTLLVKNDEDPSPMILNIFDLELLTHYLDDPYDFLYYTRQRTNLFNVAFADEEMGYLGYHLTHKLYTPKGADIFSLTTEFQQIVDQNYFAFKTGYKLSEKNDRITAKWKNLDFIELCSDIKALESPKKTDVIFHLLDISSETIDNLIKWMKNVKSSSLRQQKSKSFSFQSDKFGFTYLASISPGNEFASRDCLSIARARKYKSKSNAWIGLGCSFGSSALVDFVLYNDVPWKYDFSEEQFSNNFLDDTNVTVLNFNEPSKRVKIGRNDPCVCGSGIKYKRCCGKSL